MEFLTLATPSVYWSSLTTQLVIQIGSIIQLKGRSRVAVRYRCSLSDLFLRLIAAISESFEAELPQIIIIKIYGSLETPKCVLIFQHYRWTVAEA